MLLGCKEFVLFEQKSGRFVFLRENKIFDIVLWQI